MKWMKHLFKKKLKYVSKDFDTNLKTENSQGKVFVKKEVFSTFSLQLKIYTIKNILMVSLKDFDTSFKEIFLKYTYEKTFLPLQILVAACEDLL